MINVLIWEAAGYRESDEAILKNSIKYETVSEWLYKGDMGDLVARARKERQRALGHSSLRILLEDGSYEYLSFWPKRGNNKGLSIKDKSTFVPSYEDEVSEDRMGRAQDHTIPLENLDEQRIYDFICDCKYNDTEGNFDQYNLFTKNCSTVVTMALLSGVNKNLFSSATEIFHRVYSAMVGAAPYVEIANEIYRSRKGGGFLPENFRTTLVKPSDPAFVIKYFGSTDALLSMMEIGANTPKSVMRLASQLADIKQ